MARTRSEIEDLVELNTGRTDKSTLIQSLCNSALKLAVTKHAFHDSFCVCDDEAITEDATSVDISSLTESDVAIGSIIDIVTARIVEADGSKNAVLSMKNKQWWDRNVINPEDNQKGWPVYGLHFGSNIILDRPSNSGLELRLRVSTVPTFTADSTECPIEVLDLFVEQYVTAMVYLSLGMNDKYISWYLLALGRNYDRGMIGGTLLACIDKDKGSGAEDRYVERGTTNMRGGGITVENIISGHDRYGEIDTWY